MFLMVMRRLRARVRETRCAESSDSRTKEVDRHELSSAMRVVLRRGARVEDGDGTVPGCARARQGDHAQRPSIGRKTRRNELYAHAQFREIRA